ncbi:MAG: hypothetical protein JW384_04401 [Nitrosomonadaceae bacterium]|nr:hypothetical protein [Nitrosomonadaceae bacterium]
MTGYDINVSLDLLPELLGSQDGQALSTIDSSAAGNLFLLIKSNTVQAREFSSLQRFFFKQ